MLRLYKRDTLRNGMSVHSSGYRLLYEEISIHALRMEGDRPGPAAGLRAGISIHALRMEGGQGKAGRQRRGCISIHALRMEGDGLDFDAMQHQSISIHALRMEGDFDRMMEERKRRDFNPRPPHGGRRPSP